MLAIIGYFNKAGDPCLKVNLAGLFQENPGLEYEAILDTGFTGFLSMPLVRAFPLGLPLLGTTDSVLADGSTTTALTALCRLTVQSGIKKIETQTKTGVVSLQANASDVLLGMDFLRTFGFALVLTKSQILLYEEKATEELAKRQREKVANAEKGGAPS